SDSGGLKTIDLSELLIGLGAVAAVNFDGGWSSVFYWTPSSPAPAVSSDAQQLLANAKFPAGQRNPNNFSFHVSPLDATQQYVYDARLRPIDASPGFTYTP